MYSRIITLKHLLIDEKKYIGLKFYPDRVISSLVKSLPEVKWSDTYGMAYIENNKENLANIFNTFRGIAWVNANHFFARIQKPENPVLIVPKRDYSNKAADYRRCPANYIQKLEINNYSANTARTYISCFEAFINHYKELELEEIDEEKIRDYLQFLVHNKKSSSYLNQMVNAIKFYYEAVMGMPNRFYSIDRPRKPDVLPKVISKIQVKNLINATINIKHKCLVSLMYSSGLRRDELLNLKIEDIDSERMVIIVRNGKGKKQRHTMLSENMLNLLRSYFKQWQPETYLFEGIHGGKYSPTSVLQIVKRAAKRAGIPKKVTPHMLRHSFATHLLEDGVDLRYIQTLLGHSSTKTTEVYTQVALTNIKHIKSPLDTLDDL